MNAHPKLLDAFLYFNEMAMLKVRLEYLGPVVDEFWIIEASIDFAGRPRTFALTPEVVSTLPHADKVRIIHWTPTWILKKLLFPLARHLPNRKGLWKIQDMQRNAALTALKNKPNSDLLLFGDLDEIPDADDLQKLLSKPSPPAGVVQSFDQATVYYNIHNPAAPWRGTTFSTLETARSISLNPMRKYRNNWQCCGKGWHLSYFGSADQIKEKICAIARVERFKSYEAISIDTVQSKISLNQEIFQSQENSKDNLIPAGIPTEYTKILPTLRKYFPDST